MLNDNSEQGNPVDEVRPIEAARGQGNQGKLGKSEQLTFSDLEAMVAAPVLADITAEAFHALPKSRNKANKDVPLTRSDLKEADPFISFGAYTGKTRDLDSLKYRTALTLDFDKDVAPALRKLRMGAVQVPFAYVWHTTRSHMPDEPRFRVVVPLSRDVSKEEYTALTPEVVKLFGVPADAVSARPAQMMYLPVRNEDAIYLHGAEAGDGYLNPDYYLNGVEVQSGVIDAVKKKAGTAVAKMNGHDPLDTAVPPQGIEPEKGKAALFKLDPDCEEPVWFRYLCAWKHEYGQGEHAEWAYDTALEWSAQADARFEDEAFEDRWARAQVNPGSGSRPVTILSILEDAKASDYLERQEVVKKYRLLLELETDPQEVEELIPNRIKQEVILTKMDRKKLAKALQKAYVRVVQGLTLSLPEAMAALSPAKPNSSAALNAKFPPTEFGNTARLAHKFGKSLMFTPEDAAWYRWDNTHWHRSPEPEVKMLAKNVIETMALDTDGMKPDEVMAHIDWCKDSQRAAMVGNMVSLLPTFDGIMVPYSELDNDAMMLGVGNGAVDLETGELRKPSKSDRITITTDVDFKPRAKCPLFEKVVSDAFFDDADMVDWFQRLIGYSLMGDPKEDIIVIPYGSGSNGKSTILGTIQKVLGGHAKGTPNATFMQDARGFGSSASGPNEALLRLRASRFVYMSEPESGSQLRTSLVKSVTGGDIITARGVHAKHSVDFRPTWVVFMPTNHKPTIKDSDHGIWRRIKLVPFTRNFSDPDNGVPKDVELEAKLHKEYEGILAWCVAGATAYQERGLGGEPQRVADAHASYKAEQDLLAPWLEEQWIDDPDGWASHSELWESWKSYATRTGLLELVRSQIILSKKLEEKGYKRKTKNNVRGFEGLANITNPKADSKKSAESQGF
jgi:putative DNA primase/helicase